MSQIWDDDFKIVGKTQVTWPEKSDTSTLLLISLYFYQACFHLQTNPTENHHPAQSPVLRPKTYPKYSPVEKSARAGTGSKSPPRGINSDFIRTVVALLSPFKAEKKSFAVKAQNHTDLLLFAGHDSWRVSWNEAKNKKKSLRPGVRHQPAMTDEEEDARGCGKMKKEKSCVQV